jgi:hypothetical protein
MKKRKIRMLRVGSALRGYAIEASDGEIGTVSDFLFDDTTWRVRWLVVGTTSWLTGRKVLVYPSAIGKVDYEQRIVSVSLTKAQVKDSPAILLDQPISRQMQTGLLDYYGWDPLWGGSRFARDAIASPLARTYSLDTALREATSFETHLAAQDPHLRTVTPATARSAMWKMSCSTMRYGTFATSLSTPETGGRGNMYCCRPLR